MVLTFTGCLTGENDPCQHNAECAQKLCFITDDCRTKSYCFGACRAVCSADNTTCPKAQSCECGVIGTPDAGGCACVTADAGL